MGKTTTENQTIFGFAALANDGSTLRFDSLKGRPLLIVNTASKCGFTPHYEGLEALHREFTERELNVIGFPCDQFGHQEPGNAAEIKRFCESEYDVTFRIMDKIKVNGKETDPIFEFLKERAPGRLGKRIAWNFTKFLVLADGITVRRYGSSVQPENIRDDITLALPQ